MNNINYCPVCGTTAPEHISESFVGSLPGEAWKCDECHKVVEGYILPKEYLEINLLEASVTDNKTTNILVTFCPACRHKGAIDFLPNTKMEHGGQWICHSCEQYVEAYVLPDYTKVSSGKTDDNEQIQSTASITIAIIVIVLIFLLIVLLIFK